MTIQITYENATHEVSFEDMSEVGGWDWPSISGVTLTVTDHSGNELLAADSATLWDGVIKTGETPAATDPTLAVTDTDDANPREGARYRIVSANTGVIEDVVCNRWEKDDTNEFTITLDEDLQLAHAAADDVYGCYATYSLDVSDTDDFPTGQRLFLIWTPTGSDDAPVRFDAVIGSYEFPAGDVSDAGGTEPPSDEILTAEFYDVMWSKGIDVHRQISATHLNRGLRLFIRKEQIGYKGDDFKHELAVARTDWKEWLDDALLNRVRIEDLDEDGVVERAIGGWDYGERSV